MALVAPSILSADFARLGEEVDALGRAGADWVHVDVMDGRFVPNITIGPLVVAAVKRCTAMPLDVHLMIVEPEKYLQAFREAGADLLTVHAEATAHLHRTLQAIRSLGARAGVSLNPATPISAIENVLDCVDLVLVMSVNPGFGGQEFIPSAIEKVAALSAARAAKGHSYLIEVDGGINEKTGAKVVAAGADVLVAGNYVFREKSYGPPVARLHGAR